jgi:hypothetical protein
MNMLDVSSKVSCASLLDFSDIMTSKDIKKPNNKTVLSNQNAPLKPEEGSDPESVANPTDEKTPKQEPPKNLLDLSPEAMDMHITRVVDALLKQKIDQRPKNIKKLVNSMSTALKIPLTQSDIETLLSELVARNLIAVLGSRIQYLF